MKIESFKRDIKFNEDKVTVKVILETAYSKEIQILLAKGQLMKEHKAPYPIIIHILNGAIDFGRHGRQNILKAGDIVTLEGNVPHDLLALEDSVVRLSLSKRDKIDRISKLT